MNTGTKLKLLREKKKLSQDELAFAIGVSQTTIGNWENGRSIKHKYILKLAEILEVPTNSLLFEEDNKVQSLASEKENFNHGFEFTIKAPNNFFEDLNKKIDFLITKLDEKK